MKRLLIIVLSFIALFATPAWSDDFGNCKELLPRGLEFTRNCQAIRARVNLYNAFPAFANGLVTSVVTMPAGSNVSWVLDVTTGVLNVVPDPNSALARAGHGHRNAVKPLLIDFLGQIGNYAIVPNTRDIDGNPLEILVVGGPLLRGSVTPVKLIGAITLTTWTDAQTQVSSHKLIAVLPGTPLADSVDSLDDPSVSETLGLRTIIQTWFENYKGANSSVVEFMQLGFPDDVGSYTAYGVLNNADVNHVKPPPA